MKFFKSLFSKNIPSASATQPVDAMSLNESLENYHKSVLVKFINDRAENITRWAIWDIEALTEAIHDYKEELTYCRITETPSMCDIFEERIYQLNAAREICEKNLVNVAL